LANTKLFNSSPVENGVDLDPTNRRAAIRGRDRPGIFSASLRVVLRRKRVLAVAGLDDLDPPLFCEAETRPFSDWRGFDTKRVIDEQHLFSWAAAETENLTVARAEKKNPQSGIRFASLCIEFQK
jgi:hypothetical protein